MSSLKAVAGPAAVLLASLLAGCATPRGVVDINAPVTQAEVEAYARCGQNATTAERAQCDCTVETALSRVKDADWQPEPIVVLENLSPTGEQRRWSYVAAAERRERTAVRLKENLIERLVRDAAASCSAAPAASPA